MSEHLSIHFVEVYNKGERPEGALINLENELERWCYFFRNEGLMEESEMPEELKKDGNIWNAHKKYESFTADQELLALAEAREKWIRHYNTGMEAAREEGLEEGLKQGIEKAAREHVLKMLKDGLPAEKAALYSGLPLEEVRRLEEA